MGSHTMTTNQQQLEHYLAALEDALSGQSPALMQDALYDARNHLQEAMAEHSELNFSDIASQYGSPAEVAQQYIALELQTQQFLTGTPAARRANGFFQPLFDSRNYQALGYFFLAWPLSLAYFAWFMLVGIPTMALSLLGVGLPVLALYLKLQRYLGLFEGKLISSLLGERMPRRPDTALMAKRSPRIREKLLGYISTPLGWKITLYSAVQLPLSSLYFVCCVGVFLASFILMLSPLLDPVLHYFSPALAIDINWYWLPLCLPAGVIGLTLSLYLAAALSRLHRAIARALLIS